MHLHISIFLFHEEVEAPFEEIVLRKVSTYFKSLSYLYMPLSTNTSNEQKKTMHEANKIKMQSKHFTVNKSDFGDIPDLSLQI